MADKPGFSTRPFPRYRELIVDSGRISYVKSAMTALLEIDVTRARLLVKELRNSRSVNVSLFSFLLASIGRAVAAAPEVQAYRNLLGNITLYEDADIVVPIELEKDEGRLPYLHVIREANMKSMVEIQKEIDAAKNGDLPDRVTELNTYIRLFLLLPRPFRLLFYGLVKRMPVLFITTMGSVGVTSVGMFGASLTWGISAPVYTTNIVLGGIRKALKMINGKIENRDILHVTITMNHDLVDGAPAARFAQQLTKMIESAKLLGELLGETDIPDPAMMETKSLYEA
ncbi:MAG: 2-oxo acid dehydrogenase subunit E2 [Chitinispirillaceae bacterium]|nr:2-oxo acid dehydrogenase subunit E2 [Chitinispirillaceae bacterium]